MNRLIWTGICALAAGCIASTATAAGRDDKILEFDTMVGVPLPYTGPTNAIRGVNGGGLPWTIAGAEGDLTASGKLEIRVTGLVFADDSIVPENIRGKNTVPNFRAIVSCLSRSSPTSASTVNVVTAPFPASATGDAYIEAQLELPQPCIAPIIFVTSPTGAWFAATGM
ncbi:hypothetical protein LLG90_19210 [Aromatoleum toluclasticum]|uniref:hypothetical protein n=1 Tax=Aromatoleum toluclasticum TaxID=92003 RepID=UPI0003AB124B|nr:hypothetical protein [Aromatoleum toluclasticum]MCC4117489.1 hypothetical protein [Aromatoleum toluclasticum]